MIKLRIGIAGAGLVGGKRAAAALAGGHQVLAVTDTDLARAAALAAGCDAVAVPDLAALLDTAVDTVIIATTHDALAGIAQAALAAGKHVLVEKPAARNALELAPLCAAASLSDRVVRVGFNHRFHPALLRARELVAAGVAGPVLYVRGRYGHGGRLGMEREWRCQPECSGGGQLIDQTPHLLDLARCFLGDLRLDYAALPRLFWDTPAEDNAFLALSGDAGRLAWLHASWTEWKNLFCFEITGRDALLRIDGLGGSYGPERLTIYRMRPELGPPDVEMETFDGPDRSWEAELAGFAAAIAGRPDKGATLADAMAVLRLVEAARERGQP